MIERLVELLCDLGTSPSAEDVADLVWLAQAMGNPTFAYAEQWAADQAVQVRSHITGDLNKQVPAKDEKQSIDDNSNTKEQQGAGVSLPDVTQNHIKSRGGYPLRLPGVAALPHARKLGRELRPLKRRLPSRTRFVLDEEATTRQSADSNSLQVKQRPATERWLDLALVIDECSSMILWRQTVAEFITLLEQLGAFRTIETWYVATDHTDENLALYPTRRALAAGNDSRHPRHLVTPQGQRLVLILSDCIGCAWHTGKVAQMIQHWKKSNLVGLVQVLPEYLWERTGLRQATFVNLRAYSPGLLNEQLVVEWPWYWQSDEHKAVHLPVPIMTLEQDSLAAWASLITGRSDWVSPGVILPSGDNEVIVNTSPRAEFHTEQLRSNEELLLRFRTSASPQAQKLAGYLAAMYELSLPLIRLVQHIMCDKPTHAQLAEVICSGLLKQITSFGETLRSDEIRFALTEGLREQLLDSISGDEEAQVRATMMDSVTAFINSRNRQQIEFKAIIEDPTLLASAEVSPRYLPFAQVDIDRLTRLGGHYRDIAREMEKCIQISNFIQTKDELPKEELISETSIEHEIKSRNESSELTTLIDEQTHGDVRRILSTNEKLEIWLRQYGFQYNPFAHTDSERDYNLSEYYVEISNFDELINLNNLLVFGRTGDGKTALRFRLQSLYRDLPNNYQVFAFSYLISDELFFTHLPSDTEHFKAILTAAVRHAFVYFILYGNALLSLQKQETAQLIATQFARYFDEYYGLNTWQDDLEQAIADHSLWQIVSNLSPVFEDVQVGSGLFEDFNIDWLKYWCKLLVSAENHTSRPLPSGIFQRLQHFFQLIQTTGIQKILVLVDGIDAKPSKFYFTTTSNVADQSSQRLSSDSMLSIVRPLLEKINDKNFHEQLIWRLFLPLELYFPIIASTFRNIPHTILTWSDEDLKRLLEMRLRSATDGAITSLAQLTEEDVPEDLETYLIMQSGLSPRYLIHLTRKILEAHIYLHHQHELPGKLSSSSLAHIFYTSHSPT